MSSDHPLFDDEEIPAWMRKGGVEPEDSGGDQPPSDDLSWLDEEDPDAEKPSQAAASSGNDLPWLTNAAPASSTPSASASTDMPAWAQDPAGSGESPFGLDDNSTAQSKPGVTSALPWREGASTPPQARSDSGPGSASGTPDAGAMDWLNQGD